MTRAARVVAGATLVVGAGIVGWLAWPLPDGLIGRIAAPSVTIRDRDGVVLRTTRASDGSRARWVALDDIDPQVVLAFVAVEDRRFFDHHGIDARAVARAVAADLRAGRVVSGASTITMQLARSLTGAGRSWPGKIAQALWAVRLEWHLSKATILEQYLNRVDLGQGAIGVAAASALYFGAGASSVGLGHAALLAGMAHAPSRDNPFVAPGRARRRRAVALARMTRLGYAAPADVARANGEPLVARDPASPFLAPHFTTHLLSQRAGDGDLTTSLDLSLQTAVEAEVRATVESLRDRGARQAAAVVLDNATGEILAWVGSPDFWADTGGQADMVISPRQPGSALKPFLYGLAFDRGYTAASVMADVARTYQTTIGPYRPRNYDRRYHGPVRAREALASSYNVPAVELADYLGVGALLQTLHLAGFASLDHSAEYYGLGLALGDGDVTLLELANAYRSFADGGIWHPVTYVTGPSKQTEHDARTVMSPRAAALVLDVLSDADARVPGFGVETPFDFAFPTAVKTGTSRHFTDNWAVAVTGGFTVAVWVGNFSGQPMAGVSGVTGAGPLLHRVVLLTARRYPPGALTRPAQLGAHAVRICRLSGLRAGPWCPYADEWFTPGTEPASTCDWHQPGGRVVLPDPYTVPDTSLPAVPPAAAVVSGLRIMSPRDGDHYAVPPGVDARYATIALRVAGTPSPDHVDWSVDGRPVRGSRWPLAVGTHKFRARTTEGQTADVTIVVD